MSRRLAGLAFRVLATIAACDAACAHDQWADGTRVPAWVKKYCCGPEEAHLLDVGQVHRVVGGYRIDGLEGLVVPERVYPSQDGQVWAFYNGGFGPNALIRCLFIPWSF
ncbi:hypothetical protein SAMN05519104_6298 [Rhizobiales bacterium GAS188]|nr:hypothetical protein SAMN05519104_6298 [Rhizobiales bacterium GAS188]